MNEFLVELALDPSPGVPTPISYRKNLEMLRSLSPTVSEWAEVTSYHFVLPEEVLRMTDLEFHHWLHSEAGRSVMEAP